MKIADSSIVCGYDDFEGLEDAISKEGPEHFDKVFTWRLHNLLIWELLTYLKNWE